VDLSDPKHAWADQQLRSRLILWLTTVRTNGQPQTSPVWFVYDGESILMYSIPTSPKVANIQGNPRVAMNVDGDGRGGGILTMEGTARIDETAPPVNAMPGYVEKYEELIKEMGTEAEPFATLFSTPIRIMPTRVRVYLGEADG